jgi:hypothetical protein
MNFMHAIVNLEWTFGELQNVGPNGKLETFHGLSLPYLLTYIHTYIHMANYESLEGNYTWIGMDFLYEYWTNM